MRAAYLLQSFLLVALSTLKSTLAAPIEKNEVCKNTKAIILGAGVAGITAAQTLYNNSVTDFIIVEYNNEIGGRVKHVSIGAAGTSYIIELGANWVEGLGSKGGLVNPIWSLAQKYKLKNVPTDFSSYRGFIGDKERTSVFVKAFDEYEDAVDTVSEQAGTMVTQNTQDQTYRQGLKDAGWTPDTVVKRTVEWMDFDWEYIYPPDASSEIFTSVNNNSTFNVYSDDDNMVIDQRGFNTFVKGEASTFLSDDDPRLLLNTVVTNVAYSDLGVKVTTSNGGCFTASYAICTFSLGVLQHGDVSFTPALPDWKADAIFSFQMGTYTKIFIQFPPDKIFWDDSKEFIYYADPNTRGYYPSFQNLNHKKYFKGSGMLMVTITNDQSYMVEEQSDSVTKGQILDILRQLYGAARVPDPIDFYIPRWTQVPWAYGSFSNWPSNYSLLKHENLRANVDRLYFAGEAQSVQWYGYLQGAWDEGRNAGEAVAKCLQGNCTVQPHYDPVPPTEPQDYNAANGWEVNPL